jgi:hypothetical protein
MKMAPLENGKKWFKRCFLYILFRQHIGYQFTLIERFIAQCTISGEDNLLLLFLSTTGSHLLTPSLTPLAICRQRHWHR